MLNAEQAAKAEADARSRGQAHLADTFRRMRLALSSPKPKPDGDPRPRLGIVFNNPTWCDGRLSKEISSQLAYDFRCRLLDKTATASFAYQDDVYLFRNVSRLGVTPPPDWARDRIVCMLESLRPLQQPSLVRRYEYATLVVAQNKDLRDRARALGVTNMSDVIIGNGINCDEFYPAEPPVEFTVGAVGNFTSREFDDWKGFGRYVVRACKLAGVKLRWCGWQGGAYSLPGVQGEQVPLERMNDWYRGVSVLVSMSKSEGCSGVVFEAMASGVPVISTKVGWHGENCADEILWAHRPDDDFSSPAEEERAVQTLARRLLWLKNNPACARAIGLRGRAFAEKWPHARVADQWRSLLGEIVRHAA